MARPNVAGRRHTDHTPRPQPHAHQATDHGSHVLPQVSRTGLISLSWNRRPTAPSPSADACSTSHPTSTWSCKSAHPPPPLLKYCYHLKIRTASGHVASHMPSRQACGTQPPLAAIVGLHLPPPTVATPALWERPLYFAAPMSQWRTNDHRLASCGVVFPCL